MADSLLGTLETLAELDLIYARGRYSLDYRMTPPDFNQEGRLVAPRAPGTRCSKPSSAATRPSPDRPSPASRRRTDGAERTADPPSRRPPPSEPRTVVPIDVHLGLRFQILVVTGPNTGGQDGGAQDGRPAGGHGPVGPAHPGASRARSFPVFDDVLADIGDEQSLEQSLSTFSSHVRRVTEILGKATERSLVLLDEMGAGTDPAEGAALGRAILDELDSIGCRAIVTTHIGDLKTYAFSNPRAENAAVEFDLETLQPRYRLHIGDIGQSNALQIARRLNLPEHIVARARVATWSRAGASTSPSWRSSRSSARTPRTARQAALAAQAEAERSREALNQRLADLQHQAENDARIAEARARLQPGDRVVVPRFGYDRPGRVVKLDPRKKTAVVAIGQMQWDVAIDARRAVRVFSPARTSAGPEGFTPAPDSRLRGRYPVNRHAAASVIPGSYKSVTVSISGGAHDRPHRHPAASRCRGTGQSPECGGRPEPPPG